MFLLLCTFLSSSSHQYFMLSLTLFTFAVCALILAWALVAISWSSSNAGDARA